MISGTAVLRQFARRFSVFVRELNTLTVAITMGITALITFRWAMPRIAFEGTQGFIEKFVGVSWPFFAVVTTFLLYVIGALIVEWFEVGAPRRWQGIGHALHWATEACPLVGLLTTFLSLLTALLVYGEAGPANPETQAAFITQFAIAFGSSIAGGVLALMAFTLHRVLPRDKETAP
jgi:cellulose synthase/poly-beta-1,6-N-acetylglucosamine synthase-like glycosyltransferase